ncbi:MAG: hypothetical protein ACMUEL_01380 [Flavobacteriales bacterium Tduv]
MKESLSCMSFSDFRLENQIPYYTDLCIFRNEIVKKRHISAY